MEPRVVDWASVEREYRAGVMTLREISETHGPAPATVLKRARKHGWDRDLSQRIHAKAEAAVNKAAVNAEVNKNNLVHEEMIVEANAKAIAEIRLKHRVVVQRTMKQAERLLAEVEGASIGEPKDFAILLQKLADVQRTLISLERDAWGITAAPPEPPAKAAEDPQEAARRLAFVLARAAHTPTGVTIQ